MFNVLLECTDAHIKNYSVMLSGASVTLAPLYDLATYAPYKREGKATYSAMQIGGEYSFSAIGEKQWIQTAQTLTVETTRALDFIEKVKAGALEAFATARDELAATDTDTTDFANDVLGSVAQLQHLR